MTSKPHIDNIGFRRILARNVTLPLALGVLSAIIFVALIYNLISVLNWVQHTHRVIEKINESAKLASEMESGMRGFLLTGNETFLAPYQTARPILNAKLDSLSVTVKDNPSQVDRVLQIKAQIRQWTEYAETVIATRRKGGNYLDLVTSQTGKIQFDAIKRELAIAIENEQRLLQERNDKAITATTVSVILFLAISLIVSIILAAMGRRELIGLSNSYSEILEQQDAHAEYLQEQARMRRCQSEIIQGGLGLLALPELGKSALSILSRYQPFKIGAIYHYQEDGSLDRFATFGFDSESAETPHTIEDNVGLLGEAARTGQAMHVTEIPADYVKVNSALGSTPPRDIVIVPLKNEGEVNAVLELGFLEPVTEQMLEFLNFIAENLGNAVDGTLAKQKLQHAYAEMQQLNEELQVQQEELRTANEELEEQSSLLEESYTALENQKDELEQTNEELTQQALLLDQKNEALGLIQAELEQKAHILEQSSKYKSEFLANMSHELRTPLNSALILSKLLADNPQGNLNEEQITFAKTIYTSGNDLLNLINDILDISKVEAGKLEVHPHLVGIAQVAESMKSAFNMLAKEKKLAFQVEVERATVKTMTTDRLRLEQILKNLLSNAFKFTEHGQVSLHISSSHDQVFFKVSDTGIGIAPDQQAKVFEAFSQADGTATRKFGGTGLGLSISRDLAGLLGGAITVKSSVGQGSVFTLSCPVNAQAGLENTTTALPQAARPEPQVEAARIELPRTAQLPGFPDDRDQLTNHNRTVLVIEDDIPFAKILYDIAHELDYGCLVSHTAQEGLRMATEYLPQAILLDMRLPDTSGLSLLQQLKELPETRHIPVHAVSAVDHQDAAMKLGAIGYAVKPKTREELKEVFQKLEEKHTQKIKRVLLVEDDAVQRESVIKLISDVDIDITAVEFGEAALTELHNSVFDCMIIDLKLPDMRGNELLQRMSTESILSFPPVIVYTGRNLTREEEMELLKYSHSIIIKGARSPERLLDEVTLFLHKVESQLSSEHQSMLKTVRNRDKVFEGKKVLVVDDDVRNIFALSKVLEQKGFSVEVARNGIEALDKLDTVSEIDLVLMDIMMPEMDGYETMRQIRKNPLFARLPIIALTAKAMKDDQELCMNAGASDYLAKPLDMERLQSLLRIWTPNLERV